MSWGAYYPRNGVQIPTVPEPVDLAPHAAALSAFLSNTEEVLAPRAALDDDDLQALVALGYVAADPHAAPGHIDPRDAIAYIPHTWNAQQLLSRGRLATPRRCARCGRCTERWGTTRPSRRRGSGHRPV